MTPCSGLLPDISQSGSLCACRMTGPGRTALTVNQGFVGSSPTSCASSINALDAARAAFLLLGRKMGRKIQAFQ